MPQGKIVGWAVGDNLAVMWQREARWDERRVDRRTRCVSLGISLLGVALAAGVLLGCKTRTNDAETRERVAQEIAQGDQDNRQWEQYRLENLALVKAYEGWFEGIRAIDHEAQGLPGPVEAPDGSLQMGTESEGFCDRVAALRKGQALPDAAMWSAAYREQAARWNLARQYRDYETFRDYYLAEL